MKYRLTAFLLCMLLVLCTFAGCKSAQTDSEETTAYTIPSGAVTDITHVDSSVSTPDEKGADVNNIEGFTPEVTPDGQIAGCTFTDVPLVVSAMGSYSGKYVEDGTDDAVENICALIVKNTSDKPIQYATVTLTGEENAEYTFVLSTLPAGCSALVLETERKAYEQGLYSLQPSAEVTECEELSICEDKVKITFDGEYLHLENLTDTDFRAIYVRYKNYTSGNVYTGGITYNASFDNVQAKESYEYESAHFYTGGSQVLMVQIVE